MKKRRKWLLLGIFLVLLLLFGLSQFYAYVMKDQWNERSAAAEVAEARAGLTKVTKAQKSVWDENSIYWVLAGRNADDTELMVWVRFTLDGKPAGGDNDVFAEEVARGTSEQEIRSVIASDLPGSTIERLLPGVYNGEYVWQLFYKLEGRYYYKFYRFADGIAIGDGYSLPNR
ncbi:DUF5590 domain-containing protein [Paenibacillus sp. S150]|uniref:cell wall elongation regulator TseB-like domain-containing protein n=1 Tax=Paenibacillus sp. S150 TaxID=2749826 RepID=UPI001C566E2B|nr:DUF5590 domain-containing protein [Paenibacillus sp. S150]MBW4085354.1 DUF5590 domain-containing protein [Paenibacillus sp. S150]